MNKHRLIATALVATATLGVMGFSGEAASALNESSGLTVQRFATGDISERWSGSVTPPASGLYTFIVGGDDSDLWVDGVQLTDWWEGSSEFRYGRLTLQAGVNHDIVLDVRAPGSGATQTLEWSGPGVTRQTIATSALKPVRGVRRGLPVNAPLKDLARARGILIGAAVANPALSTDAQYRALSQREFSLAPPEWAFGDFSPSAAQRDFFPTGDIDEVLAITGPAGQQSQAFHLLWHEDGLRNPWVTQLPPAEQAAFAKARIQTLMRKYAGRVTAWNVVNEAFTDQGERRGADVQSYNTNYKNWLAYSPTMIEDAFKIARATDPNALLFYNDYDLENDGPKWEGVIAMVRDFKARGIPIDGVGFQAHLGLDRPVDDAAVRRHFLQLNALGVRARFTELDVTIDNAPGTEAERLDQQGSYYWRMTTVCLQAPNCDAINLWAISDQHSWKSKPEFGGSPAAKPMIFDSNYQPKQAYWSMNWALRRPEE